MNKVDSKQFDGPNTCEGGNEVEGTDSYCEVEGCTTCCEHEYDSSEGGMCLNCGSEYPY